MSPRLLLSAVLGALLMAAIGNHPAPAGSPPPVVLVLIAACSVTLACALLAWVLVRILHRFHSCPHLRTVT